MTISQEREAPVFPPAEMGEARELQEPEEPIRADVIASLESPDPSGKWLPVFGKVAKEIRQFEDTRLPNQ